jgi:hypothetical protein
MNQISDRLAIALLIIITLSTIITTVAYFHIEHMVYSSETLYEGSPVGEVQLRIKEEKGPVLGDSAGNLAIQINKEDLYNE